MDPNCTDQCGRTPLHVATIVRAWSCVQVLLKHGVTADRIDQVDDEGVSPIIHALAPYSPPVYALNGAIISTELCLDFRCAFLLLEMGCSIVHKDQNGESALMLAIHYANVANEFIVQQLSSGRKWLVELVELLLQFQNCNVNERNSFGMTCLHIIAETFLPKGGEEGTERMKLWEKIFDCLLESGADLSVTDLAGRTPSDIAVEVGNHWFENRCKRRE